MELIRLVVASVTGLLLVGGYLASVSAFFSGGTQAYSNRIDASTVPMLALALVLGLVVLASIPDKSENAEDEA